MTAGSRDSIIYTETRLQAGQSRVCILALGPTQVSYSTGTWVLSWGWKKWLEHDVAHSPESSTEIKNEWSYTSTPPVCLHGIDSKVSLLSPCGQVKVINFLSTTANLSHLSIQHIPDTPQQVYVVKILTFQWTALANFTCDVDTGNGIWQNLTKQGSHISHTFSQTYGLSWNFLTTHCNKRR